MTLEVRVQPRARRNALVAGQDGQWKLLLTAPAVEGRANEALVAFFAKGLGVAQSRVRLLSGEKSRQKVVELVGISKEQLRPLMPEGKAW